MSLVFQLTKIYPKGSFENFNIFENNIISLEAAEVVGLLETLSQLAPKKANVCMIPNTQVSRWFSCSQAMKILEVGTHT
jgi:hypothetical protein